MAKKKKEPEIPRQFDPSIDLDIGNLPKPWTEKQYHFALAYLANGYNATQAAISAGYSEKSAKQHSHNIMTKHDFKHVQDYIAHRQNRTLNKWAYDHDQHVGEIVKQAHFNIFDFYTPDEETGELKIDWRKVPREMGTLIDAIDTKQMAIKTVEGGEEISLPVLSTFVKFSDRTKARDMLNKMVNNYEKDNTKRLIHEGGNSPIEFKTMSMEEAAKAYQESLKDV